MTGLTPDLATVREQVAEALWRHDAEATETPWMPDSYAEVVEWVREVYEEHADAVLAISAIADALALAQVAETREEWGCQKRAYPLGEATRFYGDDEAGAREAARKVIGSGAYPVVRAVTTATLTGEWKQELQ